MARLRAAIAAMVVVRRFMRSPPRKKWW